VHMSLGILILFPLDIRPGGGIAGAYHSSSLNLLRNFHNVLS
jgi:hypothetical protein